MPFPVATDGGACSGRQASLKDTWKIKARRQDGDFAYAQRRGPGQEFPLDLVQYPEAMSWLSSLVQDFGAIDA